MNDKWIATPSHTTHIIEKYGLTMKKSLGQNFLIEPNILQKMVDVGEITPQTTVIEIGPGIGGLTQFLAEHARQVLAFEIDRRFVTILKESLALYDNVTVVHQDILKVDFTESVYADLGKMEDLVVCANLPYYITTPIIMHLIQSALPFRALVMLMQKEVAERMAAKVGTKAYNSLTLALENTMEVTRAFTVPKSVFIPRPHVDSAVLKLVRRPGPLVEVADNQDFEAFVRLAFSQRRKTLWNNLKKVLESRGLSDDRVTQMFQTAEIDPRRRAESLSIYEFANLYRTYWTLTYDEGGSALLD